jgi:Holliday junction resolvase
MTDGVPKKESDIQRLILDWLSAKKIFHYRQNSGAFKEGTRFVRFGAVGAPDIVAVVKGTYVGIEVKAPRGHQTPSQRDFEAMLRMAGGVYVLARSLEDVEAALAKLSVESEPKMAA